MADNDETRAGAAADRAGLWAKFVLYIGLIGLFALPAGALGSRFGVWAFTAGFNLLFGGVLLACIALVLGIAGFIRAKMRGRSADRPLIVAGVVASVVTLAWMGVQYNAANSVPPIHDIATDRQDPPVFDKIAALRGPGTNSLEYTEEEARQQAEGYPHLAGGHSADGVAATVERAAAIARELGWEVVNEDGEQGIVEATHTTFWFGFKDDVVIRVRPDDSGSIVDLRSVSRIGQSDLGANAARISDFLARL